MFGVDKRMVMKTNRKEVFYRIILILIGIPTLLNVSNFFVNILSVGKYYLYEIKYTFIYSPSDPLSNQFSQGGLTQLLDVSHVVWAVLAIISFFVSIFLFIKIRKTLYSENYSVLKKTGLILILIILMPVLTNAADISQEVIAMYAFNIDTRLTVISGIQENYLQMIGEIKFAIMNFLSDDYFSQSTMQTSVNMQKINRIREYTYDANESFVTCISQLEDKVLHGVISRVNGGDFEACLYNG